MGAFACKERTAKKGIESVNYKYTLPPHLIEKASYFEEFAIGGAQATIRLKDGRIFEQALLSNCTWIIAMRGFKDLPFKVEDIEDIYQKGGDRNPGRGGDWDFWDDWGVNHPEKGSVQ